MSCHAPSLLRSYAEAFAKVSQCSAQAGAGGGATAGGGGQQQGGGQQGGGQQGGGQQGGGGTQGLRNCFGFVQQQCCKGASSPDRCVNNAYGKVGAPPGTG